MLVIRIAKELLEKARRGAHLVPEKRMVTRRGTTFQTTVWVDPRDKKATTPSSSGQKYDYRTSEDDDDEPAREHDFSKIKREDNWRENRGKPVTGMTLKEYLDRARKESHGSINEKSETQDYYDELRHARGLSGPGTPEDAKALGLDGPRSAAPAKKLGSKPKSKESSEESPASRAASVAYNEAMDAAAEADAYDLDNLDPKEDLVRRTKEKYPGIFDHSHSVSRAGFDNLFTEQGNIKRIETDNIASEIVYSVQREDPAAWADIKKKMQSAGFDSVADAVRMAVWYAARESGRYPNDSWKSEDNPKTRAMAEAISPFVMEYLEKADKEVHKSISGPVASFVQEWLRKSKR